MTPDPTALAELLEESLDLQADALRPTRDSLDQLVELSNETPVDDPEENTRFRDEHRSALADSLSGAALLSAAGGAVLLGALATAAGASPSSDIQALQSAASIENLAVLTYTTALSLPYIGGSSANPVVTKFATVTRNQHREHAAAFNAAVRHLGGRPQTNPDPAFLPVINKAVASLNGASDAQGTLGVVALAIELENIAIET